MNPFPLALAELRRQRGAALAVVILIALAAALGVAAGAQERAFREASTRAAARFDLIVGAPGSGAQLVLTTIYLQPAALELLPASIHDALAADPRIEAAAPVAVTDSYRDHVVVGTTRAFATAAGLAEGRAFSDRGEAVVGAAVALPVGHRFSPSHGGPLANRLESHEHDRSFEVVGRVMATGTPWDRAIIVPIEALWSLHDRDDAGSRGVPAIVVKPRTVADAYALRAQYRSRDSTALFPAEALVPLYRLLGDARDVANGMALAFQILLVCAVLLALVTLLASRRASLGALRALGAPPAFLFAMLWLQCALLVAAGVALGAVLGALSLQVAGGWLGERTGLTLEPSLGWPEARLLLVLLGAGSLLATLPSLRLLATPVSQLLRGD